MLRCFLIIRQDIVPGGLHHGHQCRMLIIKHLSFGKLHFRRQCLVHGREKILRCHVFVQGDFHQFSFTDCSHRQRGCKGKQNVGIKAVAVADRQTGTPKGSLHGTHDVQVSHMPEALTLFKHSHDPQKNTPPCTAGYRSRCSLCGSPWWFRLAPPFPFHARGIASSPLHR